MLKRASDYVKMEGDNSSYVVLMVWCKGDKFVGCMVFAGSGAFAAADTLQSCVMRNEGPDRPTVAVQQRSDQQIQLAFPRWHGSAAGMTHCNMMELHTNASYRAANLRDAHAKKHAATR